MLAQMKVVEDNTEGTVSAVRTDQDNPSRSESKTIIKDSKVKERLLQESKLTLEKTDEICRAVESMLAQMKVVEDNTEGTVSAVQTDQDNPSRSKSKTINAIRECGNCGRKHDQQRREFCPAYGKVCNRCSKLNHFAVKCRSGKAKNKRVPVQCFQLRMATQWLLNIVYIICCCKKIIMQALVMQFGNDVGTSFLFVYADFGEYSLLRTVVNGL